MGVISSAVEWIGEKIGDAVSWVGDKISDVVDWFSGLSDISEAPSFDVDHATIDQTAKINELLSEKRASFGKIGADLEHDFIRKIGLISDSFISTVEAINADAKLKIDTGAIKQDLNRFASALGGSLTTLVTQRIALSDTQCANILKMDTGKARDKEFDKFAKTVLKEGFSGFFKQFSDIINTNLNFVRQLIEVTVDEKERDLKKITEEIDAMNRELAVEQIDVKERRYSGELDFLSRATADIGRL
jgi:hypothetical protein